MLHLHTALNTKNLQEYVDLRCVGSFSHYFILYDFYILIQVYKVEQLNFTRLASHFQTFVCVAILYEANSIILSYLI